MLLRELIIKDNFLNLENDNDLIDNSIVNNIEIDKNIVLTDLSNKKEIRLFVK